MTLKSSGFRNPSTSVSHREQADNLHHGPAV
jgi:hypothetical protein